ncbi:MAG: hypothetical protein CEO21_134, partial [Microgenomates group bacterium Gr01-1014_80]
MAKDPFAVSDLVKIGDAARILGVSIDTLRRWEKAGKITPIRTPGGTRLYSLSKLSQPPTTLELLDRKAQFNDQIQKLEVGSYIQPRAAGLRSAEGSGEASIASGDARQYPASNLKHPTSKLLTASLLALTTLVLTASFLSVRTFLPGLLHLPGSDTSDVSSGATPGLHIGSGQAVLAATSIAGEGKYLEFNADTVIRSDLAVEGAGTFIEELTAPNIIYDIIAGSGISVSLGQTPTISSAETLATVTARGSVTTTGITLGNVLNLGNLTSDPSSASNGATYYNTSSNKFRCYKSGSWGDCDTNTGSSSSGDITAVSVGNGLSGGGSSGDVTIDLDVATTSTTTTTSANSGLEATSGGLRLLGGCSDTQVLSWDAGNAIWECSTSSGSFTSFTLSEIGRA